MGSRGHLFDFCLKGTTACHVSKRLCTEVGCEYGVMGLFPLLQNMSQPTVNGSFEEFSSAPQTASQQMAQPEGWSKNLANHPTSLPCRIDANRLAQ